MCNPDDSERLLALDGQIVWPGNVWVGVSVGTEGYLFRADHLRQIRARVRLLSLEPLFGPLPGLDLTGIAWAIAGGESGPGARPMEAEWVREVRDRCLAARVPFFFKQWGGTHKKRVGRALEGRTWNEMPFAGQTSLQKARDAAEVVGWRSDRVERERTTGEEASNSEVSGPFGQSATRRAG